MEKRGSIYDSVKFRLELGMDFKPKHLKKWKGLKSYGADPGKRAIPVIEDHLGLSRAEAERVYSVLCGSVPHGYQDFADGSWYGYILPPDLNKRLAWRDRSFSECCENSVRWLFARGRRFKPSTKSIQYMVSVLRHLSSCDIKSVKEIENNIDFDRCFAIASPRSPEDRGNYEVIFLVLLGSLFLDYDKFRAVFGPYCHQKLFRMISLYGLSANPMKRYSRQNMHRDVTMLINIIKEFDLFDEPMRLLDNQDWKWPIFYKGLPKNCSSKEVIQYETIYRLAAGLPLDVKTVSRENSSARFSHFSAFVKKTLTHGSKERNGPAQIMSEFVRILPRYSVLTDIEAQSIVRGEMPLYRDSKGTFVNLSSEQLALYCALKEIGLNPYRPDWEKAREIYGPGEQNPGFCFDGTEYALRYVSKGLCYSHKDLVSRKTMDMHKSKAPVLSLLWDMHLGKPKRILPRDVKRALERLKTRGVEAARAICKLISD